MVAYNKWANDVLWASLAAVDDDTYRGGACRLFFRSMHGTVNHILLAERLWHARMLGKTMDIFGLDDELESDRDALHTAMNTQCDAWVDFVAHLDEADLLAPFSYVNTEGIDFSRPLGAILLHVMNHATHHRGQISAALTYAGHDAPEMDLLYYYDPNA